MMLVSSTFLQWNNEHVSMWEGLEKKKVNYYEWIQGKTNANRRVASSEMEEISHLLPWNMMKHETHPCSDWGNAGSSWLHTNNIPVSKRQCRQGVPSDMLLYLISDSSSSVCRRPLFWNMTGLKWISRCQNKKTQRLNCSWETRGEVSSQKTHHYRVFNPWLNIARVASEASPPVAPIVALEHV